MQFFVSQTKLKVSYSKPYYFYIVMSNTITNKCNLLRDLPKLFSREFPFLHEISSPSPDRAYTHVTQVFNSQ